MSELSRKQQRFTSMVALLITFINQRGYQVTFGDAYRDPRCPYGHPDSTHRSRLAIDLNLFKDGIYLSSGEEHEEFHDYWDDIGGAKRIEGDLNHYSLMHNGVR